MGRSLRAADAAVNRPGSARATGPNKGTRSYDRRVARDSRDILDDPPPPAADARLAYGTEPKQFGDLRLPPGDGPFPPAGFVHGGAWEAQYNLISAGHLCVELRHPGIATGKGAYRPA